MRTCLPATAGPGSCMLKCNRHPGAIGLAQASTGDSLHKEQPMHPINVHVQCNGRKATRAKGIWELAVQQVGADHSVGAP